MKLDITHIKVEKIGFWWFNPTRWRATGYINKQYTVAFGHTRRGAMNDFSMKVGYFVKKELNHQLDSAIINAFNDVAG